MARKSIQELGDLQKTVMEIVWELEEASAQQVLDEIRRRLQKELAYTTVLSVLQKLDKAGWLRHRREGRTHVFRGAQSREDAGRRSLRQFTERVFRGDPMLLVEHLVRDARLTSADLDALHRLILKRRKELGDE